MRRIIESSASEAAEAGGYDATYYHQGFSRLVAHFRGKGVRPEEAADLAHETMLRTLVHLKRHGRRQDDLGPLVRTIAHNLLVERIRRTAPRLVPLDDAQDVAATDPGPADTVLAAERRTAVREAVRSLSPRHRHVVTMWMAGTKPAEIARQLGVRRNAVDAILHRARRTLAAKLSDSGVLGVVGGAGFRLRAVVRRIADAVAGVDPGGQAVYGATGLVALGIAAVVSVSPMAHAPSTARVHVSTGAVALPVASLRTSAAHPAQTARDVRAAATRHRITYTREIGTHLGRRRDRSVVELGIIQHDTDDGKESALAPAWNTAADQLCARAPGMCREGR